MDETWEFRTDGSGTRRVLGPFGHVHEEVTFDWRSLAERVIESRVVAARKDGVARDLDDDEREWKILRYDFQVIPGDTGGEIGLVETSAEGAFSGFGEGMVPLAFRGPLTD